METLAVTGAALCPLFRRTLWPRTSPRANLSRSQNRNTLSPLVGIGWRGTDPETHNPASRLKRDAQNLARRALPSSIAFSFDQPREKCGTEMISPGSARRSAASLASLPWVMSRFGLMVSTR